MTSSCCSLSRSTSSRSLSRALSVVSRIERTLSMVDSSTFVIVCSRYSSVLSRSSSRLLSVLPRSTCDDCDFRTSIVSPVCSLRKHPCRPQVYRTAGQVARQEFIRNSLMGIVLSHYSHLLASAHPSVSLRGSRIVHRGTHRSDSLGMWF